MANDDVVMTVDPIIAEDIKPLRSNFLSCRGVVPGDHAVHPAHISASIVMINTDIEGVVDCSSRG